MSPMHPFDACISGMVIHVRAGSMDGVIQHLQSDPHITIGERCGEVLAIVLETPTGMNPEEAYCRLAETPGILRADLVYAQWIEEETVAATGESHWAS